MLEWLKVGVQWFSRIKELHKSLKSRMKSCSRTYKRRSCILDTTTIEVLKVYWVRRAISRIKILQMPYQRWNGRWGGLNHFWYLECGLSWILLFKSNQMLNLSMSISDYENIAICWIWFLRLIVRKEWKEFSQVDWLPAYAYIWKYVIVYIQASIVHWKYGFLF